MRVTILFFAAAREAAGSTHLVIELPSGSPATIGGALAVAAASRTSLGAILPSCRTALDEEFAPATAEVREGSVIAVLPPVSGG